MDDEKTEERAFLLRGGAGLGKSVMAGVLLFLQNQPFVIFFNQISVVNHVGSILFRSSGVVSRIVERSGLFFLSPRRSSKK